jgi:hypothetical protein
MAVWRCAFDPARDAVNQAKHGASLALAEILFAAPYAPMEDDRFEGHEARAIAFGHIADRLFACVYLRRGGERRILSLRKANQREVARYGHDFE